MDFSWGWVTPFPMVTTERLAKARLELARTAIPPALGTQPVGKRPETGSHQRPQLLAPGA
jgi:hypothetical protein